MDFQYLKVIENFYEDEEPLITDSLSDEVKDALFRGSDYFFEKFEEKVHDIVTGEKNGE
jgi:hypothetical protein